MSWNSRGQKVKIKVKLTVKKAHLWINIKNRSDFQIKDLKAQLASKKEEFQIRCFCSQNVHSQAIPRTTKGSNNKT